MFSALTVGLMFTIVNPSFAHSFALSLGWLLAISAIFTFWPQSLRLLRKKDASGVNPRSLAMVIVTYSAWSIYCLRIKDYPATLASISPLIAWIFSLYLLITLKVRTAVKWLSLSLALSFILILIGLSKYYNFIGLLAVIGTSIWALPQLKTAFTERELRGVSPLAYFAISAEHFGWIIYAILTKTPAYIFASGLALPATLTIAFRVFRSQRGGVGSTMYTQILGSQIKEILTTTFKLLSNLVYPKCEFCKLVIRDNTAYINSLTRVSSCRACAYENKLIKL